MNRRELIKYLNSLETRFPVNSWEYPLGFNLWPYIKIRLFFSISSDNIKKVPESHPSNRIDVIKKTFVGAIYFFKYYFKKSNSHYIFCEATHFKQREKGFYKTRYYNQLVSTAKEEDKNFLFIVYENLVEDFETKVDFPEQTLHLHKVTYWIHFLKKLYLFFYNPRIKNGESLDNLIEEVRLYKGNKLSFDQRELAQDLIYIEIWKKFFKKILQNNGVKEVFMLCYYHRLMFPMVMACKELDIPTTDIQHGGQGDHHIAYSKFNAVPENGYGMLPKKFWCWDKGSASVLQNWISKQNYHEVEIGGNPWLEFKKESYYKTLGKTNKIILYTMQPHGEELIEKYIIDAISKTPDGYSWWLRLHPRQLDQKEKLLKIIKNNQITSKVEIDKASDYDLPFLLQSCHVHISKFSGSILEAFLLHKKSIIIDEIGEEMFPEVLKSEYGVSATAQDSQKLLQEILNAGEVHQ